MKINSLLLTLLLLLTACHKHKHEDIRPQLPRRTVIVYMMAENSLNSFKMQDLNELESAVGKIPLDCRLVVYLDDIQMPTCYTYSAQTGRTLWKTFPEQDSCDSLVFRNTLAEIVHEFQAESYGLVMWSHGSGWIPQAKRAIGIDNNSNTTSNFGTELEIPSMRRMLEQLGVHWDYIFFDACFMQCVEVDYELRGVCDHVVASPAEIPAEGAPYDRLMPHFFLDTCAADSIAHEYYDAFVKKDGLIISVSKSSEMENLAKAMKPLISERFADRIEYDISSTQAYSKFTSFSVWKPEYYDMGSIMHNVLINPVAYNAYLSAVNRAYPVQLSTDHWRSKFFSGYQGNVYDKEHISAVSMFVPMMKYEPQDYNEALHAYQWYDDAGWSETGW